MGSENKVIRSRKPFRKILSIWLVFALLLSVLPLYPDNAAAAESAVPEDGVYTVDYLYYHSDEDSVSVANTYMKSAGQKGTLTIENGVAVFEHTVTETNAGYFPYLGYRKDGSPKATISNEVVTGIEGYQEVTPVVGSGEAADSLIQYNVSDITQKLDILMHVNITALGYNHWYNARLWIDVSQVRFKTPGGNEGEDGALEKLTAYITEARTAHDAAVEGENYGDYAAGSKAALLTAITTAETKLAAASDNEAYTEIYTELVAAKVVFDAARKLADHSALLPIITQTEQFLATAKRSGETEGSPGSARVVYMAGEYDASAINSMATALTTAKDRVNNPKSTPANITNSINVLTNRLSAIAGRQYVSLAPYKIYALDNGVEATSLSQYASEIGSTVTPLVQSEHAEKQENMLGYLTLLVRPETKVLPPIFDGELWHTFPAANGYTVGDKGEIFFSYGSPRSQTLSTDTQNVYQVYLNGTAANEGWEGMGAINYTVGGVERTVYISYNAEVLEALKQAATDAGKLALQAKTEAASQEDYDAAKTALQEAIADAEPITANLASKRPAILTAQAALQQAVDAFTPLAKPVTDPGTVPGTGVGVLPDGEYPIGYHIYKDGTKEDSVMTEYVDMNSGKLTVENGNYFVSFKLNKNAEITSFKTEVNGALVETQKVSENTADNTRVVRFPVSDLTATLNAWVKIYWVFAAPLPAYDHEYNVDLAFDAPVIEEEQHDLNFSVLHATQDKASSMDNYFIKPGKYSEADGKTTVTLTLKDSTTVPSFKVEQDGVLTETTVISTDTAANTRVVQFEVADRNTLLNAQVHVSTVANGQAYEMDHKIRLKLYTTNATALSAKVAEAEAAYANAAEGTTAGKYPAAAKTTLQEAITAAKLVAASQVASQQTIDDAAATLGQALKVFKASVVLEEAEYKLSLPTSTANYLSSEGKLDVSDGKQTATFELKDGVTLQKLQVRQQDDTLEDAEYQVSGLTTANLRSLVSASFQRSFVAAAATPVTVTFEVDRTKTYVFTVLEAEQQQTFDLAFADVTPEKVDEGTDPGTSNPGTGTTDPEPVNIHGIKDGVYTINYRFVADETTSTSVMNDYVVHPGLLTVTDGDMEFEFILMQSKEVVDFKITRGGSLITPAVTNRDTENNTRTYSFSVSNLDDRIHGWVDIDWPEMNYDHEYNVDLVFTRSSLKRVSTSGGSSGSAVKPLSQTYKVGEHSIEYALQEQGKKDKSLVSDYVKHPAALIVEDNKSYLQLTVSNQEVTNVEVVSGGTQSQAEVVSTDASKNERTIRFEVTDLKAVATIRLTMAVPFKFVGGYLADVVLDPTTVKLVKEAVTEEEEPEQEETSTETPTVNFSDIGNHWAKALIEKAAKLGAVTGYSDGTFRPNNLVTRAEFIAMLSRGLKLTDSANELTFTDKAAIPAWVKPQLAAVYETGIVKGFADGSFRADSTISRLELAVLMARALKLELGANAKPDFKDAANIPAWAQAEVAAVQQLGIMKGQAGNVFNPNASATRAEVVAVILALYGDQA
nr:NEAT domain-containing protein [Paenibacillus phyllosphaerae]